MIRSAQNLAPSLQNTGKGSITIVVPFMNEADSLVRLYAGISEAMKQISPPWELIFVDDGSTDDGSDIAAHIAQQHKNVTLIRFTRNFGKAAALSAGMSAADGDIIITMDADLQDDPMEIKRFISKLSEGYDIVSGWKKKRHDPVGKTLPSRVFNCMTSKVFNIKLHDINCGFKAYSRRAARQLDIYGELHRFTPALLQAAGFSCAELVVQHHAREFGQSKYGIMRMVKGFLDVSTVLLITRFRLRPLHFFAMIGLPLFIIGISFVSYLTVLWFLGMGPIGNRPLLLISILLIVTGVQIISVGLVSELFLSTKMQEKDKYIIDEIISSPKILQGEL